MNVGYVRLSRDDDKRNYVSIENQKLIISQYVEERNMVIDRWYEDDGISGYKFDRPGFCQLMSDLNKDVETVFVKDFSRLGRHNARVLLLIDEFLERGKRLIVIDDNYDSSMPDDDTIGIKTWYNERYVKDTSKKIKHAIGARQKEGTLMTKPPFGYKRNEKEKSVIEIVPKEAEYIRLVCNLYLKGFGYRKIANYLTELGVPTPSMIRHEREMKEGRITKHIVVTKWSDSMIKELLDNDYYIGTLRLKKRTRATVHGKDKRVPKKEQYVFAHNHPPIIDQDTFDLVQELKAKRVKQNYRGSHGQWSDTENLSPFGSCLYCKSCGSRLTPIHRQTSTGHLNYYICNTYNTKGKLYCERAHLIEEQDLMKDVITYLKLCRDLYWQVIATYNIKEFELKHSILETRCLGLQKRIDECKNQLKVLLSQKIRDLADTSDNGEIIKESYEAVQKDILAQIGTLKIELNKQKENNLIIPKALDNEANALEVLDKIIANGVLDRKDMEFLIERIEVDEYGSPEIFFREGLSNYKSNRLSRQLNSVEHEIIYHTLKLILSEERRYTSAKYLSKRLSELGYNKSKNSVLPYIGLMLHMGILSKSDNPRKPYIIIKSASEIQTLMSYYAENLHGSCVNRWNASDGA